MQNLEKDFWKFATTVKGSVPLDMAFIRWVKDNNVSLVEAKDLWGKVHKATEDLFKKANNVTVEISGDQEAVKDMLSGVGDVGAVNIEEEPPPLPPVGESGMPEVPVEPRQQTKTLIEALEEPEETVAAPLGEETEELPPLPS